MYIGNIIGGIEGETYIKLINYLFKNCDTLRVTFWVYFGKKGIKRLNEPIIPIMDKFEKEFSYLIIKKYKQKLNKRYAICYYMRLNADIKKYLLLKPGLFSCVEPNDLTFFKNDYCVLGSISHEKIGWICCNDLEEYEIFKTLGIKFVDRFSKIEKEKIEINKMIY